MWRTTQTEDMTHLRVPNGLCLNTINDCKNIASRAKHYGNLLISSVSHILTRIIYNFCECLHMMHCAVQFTNISKLHLLIDISHTQLTMAHKFYYVVNSIRNTVNSTTVIILHKSSLYSRNLAMKTGNRRLSFIPDEQLQGGINNLSLAT